MAVSDPNRSRDLVFLLLLLALALTRGVLYAALTPPWQAPDEPQHYQMVRLMMDLRRIPRYLDAQSAVGLHTELVDSLLATDFWETRYHLPPPEMWGIYSATNTLSEKKMMAAVSHPPLYYALGALVLWPFRFTSILTQLYVLRCLSVVMGLVTVGAVYVVGSWLSPRRRARVWAAVCFVVFLPMHSFVSASLNNDALAEFFSSLVFVLLASLCVHGLTAAHEVGFPLLVLLGLFTKRTDLFLVPLVVGALGWYFWVESQNRKIKLSAKDGNNRPERRIVLVSGAILAVLVGIMLCDVLLWRWWSIAERVLYVSNLMLSSGISLTADAGFVLLGFTSFWGNFGWMNVQLDVVWYVALVVLSILAALGGAKGAWRLAHVKSCHVSQRCIWGICVLALLWIAVQSVLSVLSRQIPLQGRYLFPALVPIALCFTWGVFEWVPPRHHRMLLVLWVVWWIVFDGVAMLRYVLPYYYG